jgi:hypothetical protein
MESVLGIASVNTGEGALQPLTLPPDFSIATTLLNEVLPPAHVIYSPERLGIVRPSSRDLQRGASSDVKLGNVDQGGEAVGAPPLTNTAEVSEEGQHITGLQQKLYTAIEAKTFRSVRVAFAFFVGDDAKGSKGDESKTVEGRPSSSQGFISRTAFKVALLKIGLVLQDKDRKILRKSLDDNNDKQITYDEFKRFIRAHRRGVEDGGKMPKCDGSQQNTPQKKIRMDAGNGDGLLELKVPTRRSSMKARKADLALAGGTDGRSDGHSQGAEARRLQRLEKNKSACTCIQVKRRRTSILSYIASYTSHTLFAYIASPHLPPQSVYRGHRWRRAGQLQRLRRERQKR